MLWGNKDLANNSPAFATAQVNLSPTAANANTLFGNTSYGVFLNNGVATKGIVGQFGVDTTEAANSVSEGTKVAHAGWNLRTAGVGPLGTVTVTTPGRGYANSDTFSIAGASGNATGNLVTNATGNVVSYSIKAGGSNLFSSATPTVSITTGAGTGAALAATANGRAGRVSYETLVAMGSMTGDSDGTLL